MELFNSFAWDVQLTEERGSTVRVTLQHKSLMTACPECHLLQLGKFGTRKAVYNDLPALGKRMVLNVIRQRYKCADCRKTFLETTDLLNSDHRLTQRAVDYILDESARRTHANIAQEIGVDSKTVWNVFETYTKMIDDFHKTVTPEVLGIDEVFAMRRARCVLTNIRDRTVLDFLPDRDQYTVIKWLTRLDDHSALKVITMDMWTPYRRACQIVFPHVPIVIDKFHVIRLANLGMENYRKTLKASLAPHENRRLKKDRYLLLKRHPDLKPMEVLLYESWIGRFPLLKEAHRLKEEFFRIYDCVDRKSAEQAYDQWLASVPKPLHYHFNPLIRAVRNWHNEIFTYFDIQPRVTNAFTESANNLIKKIVKDGRGYSFLVLRNKVLFTKRKVLPVARRVFEPDTSCFHFENQHPCIDLGADLSTLIDEYEVMALEG